MADTEKKLTQRDHVITTLRAYFLQNGFNYSNYQGLGYAKVMYPALKKLHGDDTDGLVKDLAANSEFYNTNPNLLPFVTSLHMEMSEQGYDYDGVRGLKMALMGPLAGIGDSLSQFCLAPLFSTIFASMAMQGFAFAPIGFFLCMNLVLLTLKFVMSGFGRKLGTAMIDKLSSQMGLISQVANMIGVTVICGLSAIFIKMKVDVTLAPNVAEASEKAKIMTIQGMLDNIAPALLPMLYMFLMYYLIKKRNWDTYKLVILTVVLGLILSALHILV